MSNCTLGHSEPREAYVVREREQANLRGGLIG